jgi:1-acyl-sn-glycerol-3-phosphate acyltransferase
MITSLYVYTFLRARSISTEKVPGSGAVILAPNHFSFMDHFLMGVPLRRKVRFMAKSQLFKRPMQFIYSHGGVFPVRRGARDEEAFITAKGILVEGGAITMYCEGGRSRTGEIGREAKRGIGRLALETGAPVVPIAIHGSSHVRNWKRLRFPKVTILYGDALRWERIENPSRSQQQAVADEILVEIRKLYAGLQEHGRKGVLRRVRAERRVEHGAHRAAPA